MLYILLNPFNRILNNSKNTRKYRLCVYQSIPSSICEYKYKINNSSNLKYTINSFLNITTKNKC